MIKIVSQLNEIYMIRPLANAEQIEKHFNMSNKFKSIYIHSSEKIFWLKIFLFFFCDAF